MTRLREKYTVENVKSNRKVTRLYAEWQESLRSGEAASDRRIAAWRGHETLLRVHGLMRAVLQDAEDKRGKHAVTDDALQDWVVVRDETSALLERLMAKSSV